MKVEDGVIGSMIDDKLANPPRWFISWTHNCPQRCCLTAMSYSEAGAREQLEADLKSLTPPCEKS